MPKVIITHRVADMDKWLRGKAERAEQIGVMGGADVVDHVAQDGSNAIAVTFTVEDVAAVMAAISSPSAELGEAMERHGVIPPLAVYVER